MAEKVSRLNELVEVVRERENNMLRDLIIKERNSKLTELTDSELLNILAFGCNGVNFSHTSEALRNEINSRGIDSNGMTKIYQEQLRRIKDYSSRSDFFTKKSFANFIFYTCCGAAIGYIATETFERTYEQSYIDFIGLHE